MCGWGKTLSRNLHVYYDGLLNSRTCLLILNNSRWLLKGGKQASISPAMPNVCRHREEQRRGKGENYKSGTNSEY